MASNIPTQSELEKKDGSDDITESKTEENEYFPIKVFARIRPLIKDEIESKHDIMKWECEESDSNKSTITLFDVNDNNSKSGNAKKSAKQLKYVGFESILTPKDDNNATFAKCILPSLQNMFDAKTICCFAYGHTGSGKTHTMLGKYNRADEANNVSGLFELTAHHLFSKIKDINSKIENDSEKILIELQFAEVYKNKIRDLFSTPKAIECHIREGSDGFTLRGPTIKDAESGKVRVTTLTSIEAATSKDVILNVKEALLRRNVGNSTLHDESSRSHAFLTFEFVNKKIIDARLNVISKESEVVPFGKQRDDMKIAVAVAGATGWKQDPVSKQYYEDPNFKPNEEQQKLLDELDALEKKVNELEEIHKDSIKKLDDIMRDGKKLVAGITSSNANGISGFECFGGMILFVDLAGNEYGSDMDAKGITKQELREMKEINKSLLALKECIRKMHDKEAHIPFRDSIITKVLKKHLIGEKSNGIMIANLSSSQQHIKKSVNTLKYTQLVGIA